MLSVRTSGNYYLGLIEINCSSILYCLASSFTRHSPPDVILSCMERQEIIEKIKRLPHDRLAEVDEFLDALSRRPSRAALHRAIRDYALKHGGTGVDLDPDLEAAGVEHLLKSD